MVRKVIVFACMLALFFGFAMTTQAASVDPDEYDIYIYESTSLLFDDDALLYIESVINNLPFGKDYFAFKRESEDYEVYQVIVTDEYNFIENPYYQYGIEILDATIYEYAIYNNGWNDIDRVINTWEGSCFLDLNGYNVYSSISGFPTLTERGDNYAILQTILVVVFLLSCVLSKFFRPR